VGGLIVSTGLTLFLVPCVYEFFYRRIQQTTAVRAPNGN